MQEHVIINLNSHTLQSGRYKGRIPPGPELDETEALKAAVRTLKDRKSFALDLLDVSLRLVELAIKTS